jgi:hypothetical protein
MHAPPLAGMTREVSMRSHTGFHSFVLFVLFALFTLAPATGASAQDWRKFTANDYGFSMLVPAGTNMATKVFGGGWGGLVGDSDGTTVIGVAKLGAQENAADIEAFGVGVTGIPAARWTLIDEGSGNGWSWYRTVSAQEGSKAAFGGYGVGPRGSYLLLLVTTPEDFSAYRSDFETWYESIELF